ncbi:type III secretion protein [Caballeronia sp. EK]|uniref:type III secretion protein n=1 Tax=Caballeronia sp. EK TaxID=2767469 RepID=UPI0016561AD8|nr:type III secretion protein [Caballeronia sp. EK]MBC8642784.1 type III secretion protein [Caballeronia sp. EK]
MLKQLLEIKSRREQRCRRSLARLADDDLKLVKKQEALHVRRRLLQERWRVLAATSGEFTQHKLATLRADLAKLKSEDQTLQRHQEALVAERSQLATCRAEQETLLRRNLREQEKLMLLLENV